MPFTLVLIAVAAAIFAFGRWLDNSYAFVVGYIVVQYMVLGTAWNILSGYTGYAITLVAVGLAAAVNLLPPA